MVVSQIHFRSWIFVQIRRTFCLDENVLVLRVVLETLWVILQVKAIQLSCAQCQVTVFSVIFDGMRSCWRKAGNQKKPPGDMQWWPQNPRWKWSNGPTEAWMLMNAYGRTHQVTERLVVRQRSFSLDVEISQIWRVSAQVNHKSNVLHIWFTQS